MDKIYNFDEIKAIIGLGNPGAKYSRNRHNIGFRVLDVLSEKFSGSWSASDKADHCQISIPGEDFNRSLYLVKPMTFMNSSGQSLPFLLKKGIKGENIIVVHDELEKPFGKISTKWSGSARGHNGLRSIEGVIGKDFWRLRFGIGRPAEKKDVGNYVLTNFSKQEEEEVGFLIENTIDLIFGN